MISIRSVAYCLVLAGVTLGHHPILAEEEKEILSESQALDILIQTVERDALYEQWTKLECLRFGSEEKMAAHFDFVIREKHGGVCPGDPNTEPVVDRFRVMRLTRKLLWYDLSNDEYVIYDRHRVAGKP